MYCYHCEEVTPHTIQVKDRLYNHHTTVALHLRCDTCLMMAWILGKGNIYPFTLKEGDKL